MALYSVNEAKKSIQDDPLFSWAYRFRTIPNLVRLPAYVRQQFVPLVDITPRLFSKSGTPSTDAYSNGAMATKDLVYFNAKTLDSGIVSVEQVYNFKLCSFFAETQTIADIFVTPSQSVRVTTPVVGAIMKQHTSIPMSITIDEEGSAKIDADIIFTLSNGHRITFRVVAIRTPLGWLFTAQWKDGLEYTRRFLTSVESSDTGAEFRKILRNTPIREAVIPLVVDGVSQQYFAQLTLKATAETEQLIPIYSDEAVVTAPCVKTTYRVYCPTSTYRFKVSGFAVICKKSAIGTPLYELIQITTIHADGLTLRYPLGENYVKGDAVYPLEECVIRPDGLSLRAMTDRVSEATITATSKANSVSLENPTYSPSTYLGIPIYPFRTNWIDGTDIDIVSAAILEDSGRGHKNYMPNSRAYSTWNVSSFFSSRADYWKALGFFNYLRGRGKPFFMAYPLDWLPFESALDNHTFKLTDETFGLHIEDKIKYLYLSNGVTSEIVTVTDIYTSGTGGAVIVTTVPAITGVTSIAQAVPVRLSSDEITETWLTDGCVEIKFDVMELQKA